MRRSIRWLLLVVFVVVNGVIVFWAWRQLSDAADEVRDRAEVSRDGPSDTGASKAKIVVNASPTKEEDRQSSSELQANTDKMAYDLIAKWNRDPVIDLASRELRPAVESLPEAGCILLPKGATPLGSAMLPEAVKQDLDAAVAGLLEAYRDATPDAVIDYMSARGKIVNPTYRKRMEKALGKRGITDLEKLTDENIYRTMFKSNAHWSGLVADSSCRQYWDGKNTPFNRVRTLNKNFTTGALTKDMEQSDYLVHLLRGVMTGPHNFVSTKGSLDDAHKSGARVLLCDLQLVMELDESFARAKAPYLIRFWFNETLQKWQPIDMISFASSPKGGPLPDAPF